MRAAPTFTLGVIVTILLLASPAAAGPWTDRYDREIERSTGRWWPDLPIWRLWKAQLHQESRLDPNAVSPVGATGIAQMMPQTWVEVMRQMGHPVMSDRRAAALAIEAGAFMMANLRRQWRAERPVIERHWLAAASYNSGLGNILKAQKLCGDARLWAAIQPCLVRVTGPKNSHETTTYLQRIVRWWRMMEAEG